MILIVNLKNKKFCDDCPCLTYDSFCSLGFRPIPLIDETVHMVRPVICVEENGE